MERRWHGRALLGQQTTILAKLRPGRANCWDHAAPSPSQQFEEGTDKKRIYRQFREAATSEISEYIEGFSQLDATPIPSRRASVLTSSKQASANPPVSVH